MGLQKGAARFGQILPGRLRAKFGPEPVRQNLAKSSRAFLIAYEEQPDLAKFCPEPARQNLAKSSRDLLEARNYVTSKYLTSLKFLENPFPKILWILKILKGSWRPRGTGPPFKIF